MIVPDTSPRTRPRMRERSRVGISASLGLAAWWAGGSPRSTSRQTLIVHVGRSAYPSMDLYRPIDCGAPSPHQILAAPIWTADHLRAGLHRRGGHQMRVEARSSRRGLRTTASLLAAGVVLLAVPPQPSAELRHASYPDIPL